MSRKKEEELKRLVQQINQWNIDHFDLFELSQPNEDLDFHGVIRFFFQDEGQKVSTKCVRVASTACTQEVVDVLVEKFRPDMRMLTPTSYSLYEVHVTGEERKMSSKEKPLLIQLNWGKDVREGRFLLKRDSDQTIPKEQEVFEIDGEMKGFKRKLSKREKKEKKKREKDRIKNKENFGQGGEPDHSVAGKHYNELPETSFTRSISNPEAVMKRRRQQKLEKKLDQIRNQGPNSAGTLKIYGESLNPDVPYKTLLLSSSDPVWYVTKETLEKYGMEKEDPKEYCLVQVSVPFDEREYHGGKMGEERRLELDECPLAIAMQHPPSKGTLLFQIRKKNVDEKRKAKKLRAVSHEELRFNPEPQKSPEKLPFLLELIPDGSENPRGRRHQLQFDVTEVGSDQNVLNSGQSLVIPDRSIQPRHCVIAHTEGGIVTVTPTSREAETYVNNHRIYETTILKEGMTVAFGRNNLYRFVHPMEQEKQQKAQFAEDIAALKKAASPERKPQHPPNFNETTFDIDGHVETNSGGQFGKPPDKEAMQNRSPPQKDVRGPDQLGKLEDALPVALEFREDAEDHFLTALISDVNGANASFKLAPTYTVYMGIRYRLSMMYRPDMSPTERAHRLTSFINKVASLVQQTIQDQHDNPSAMSFWMANASELLHFCKQDHDVHPFSQDAQEVLAESVQIAFHHLVRCLQQDLQSVMMAFLDENEDKDDDDFMNADTLTRRYKGRPVLSDVLNTLSSAMHLLRRCRVNAALTIQLFSQLFHFINMSMFNTLVTQPQMRLCTMQWGVRLKRRLGRVEAWAEKQGLELAADCHLCRIIQAAHLLQAQKSSPDHIAYISSTCFKLNSLQLRVLLEQYIPEPNEPPIPQTLIEKVVAVAENMADELTRTDGRDIQLEEDPDLQLPFLLPEDGYSCDIIRGVPNGLLEFLEPLSRSGLCRTMVQQAAVGDWTVYMVPGEENKFTENVRAKAVNQPPIPADLRPAGPSLHGLPKEPESLWVTFSKVNGSMGLSIVAARGESEKESGIYIKSVVPQGAAALDGRLTAGDQLLEVDGKSLVGLSQEKAAELMTRTGQTVSLKVAKQGAIYHGLAKLLSQPSPIMQQRGAPRGQMTPGPQMPHVSPPRHEEAPPPYYNDPRENGPYGNKPGDPRDFQRDPGMVEGKFRPGLQQSQLARSSPSLNSDISNSERQRATSTSNIRDDRPAPPNSQAYKQPQGFPEMDSRSKSTSNLLGQPDMYGRQEPQPIRGAASTSVLPRNQQNRDHPRNEVPQGDPRGYDPRSADPQHYNGGLNVDYVNQPHGDPRHPMNRGQPQGSPNYSRRSNDSRGSNDVNKWSPPQQGVPPANKRTSSSSSSSLREENRPRSAYITQPERSDYPHSRPKSEEIEAARVREWQERNERSINKPQLSPNAHPGEKQNAGYNNARPGPPSGYGQNTAGRPNQDIPRATVNNQQKQAGFYANTTPRPQDPTPPFHQLPVHPELQELDRPQIKPVITPKPGVPKIQHLEVTRSQVPTWKNPATKSVATPKVSHVEIPRQSIDNRTSQPQFFEQKNRRPEQRPEQRLNSSSSHPDQRTNIQQDPRLNLNNRQDPRSNINTHQDPRSNLSNHQDPRSKTIDPRDSRSNTIDPRDPRSNTIDPRDPRSNTIDPRDPRSNTVDPRDPRHQQNYQQNPQHPQATPNTSQSQHSHSHQMSYYGQQPTPAPSNHSRYPPNREVYGQPQEFPPPPEVPPELPPPPEEVEELPPPPPPPSQDYRLAQQIREEEERLMQQLNNQFDGPEAYRDPYMSSQGYPDPSYNQHSYDPQRQQADPYTSQPNYQNINRFQKDGSGPGEKTYESRSTPPVSQPQSQSNLHSRQEQQYDPRERPPQPQDQVNNRNDLQAYRRPQAASKPKNTNLKANQPDQAVSPSPWEREEKEKEVKNQETTLKQMREQEIAELERRMAYLTPMEEDRLKKLRLEQEFQRRVEEVDNRDDDEDEDSDNEVSDHVLQREQHIQTVKDDLLKTKLRLEEMSQRRKYDDYDREKDRMERLQRKLEMFEKEREQQRSRQKKKQEVRERKQNEYLQGQREMREKQRREFEENKRLLMQEEEKMHQRKMEEIKRKRELEREQLREMQAAREVEEAALRAEAKKQEEEYARQRLAQQEKERLEQQREIRVREERKRLDILAQQNQTPTPYHPPYNGNQPQGYQPQQYQYGYQQPPHLAQQPQVNNHHQMDSPTDRGMLNAPPPPERKSSYEYVHQHQQSFLPDQTNYMNSSGYHAGPGNLSSLRNNPEGNNGPPVAKKSVSFNSQLETQINTYSVSSEDDRSQHPSYSSYRSSGSSQDLPSPNDSRYPGANPAIPITPGPNDVFQTPPQNSAVNISYKVTDTPGVVGAQEVYRDPRSRIQAKKAQLGPPLKGNGTERMSFRDKMKFFAQEAGENTPVEKPKASRSQRTIESQIMNGQ